MCYNDCLEDLGCKSNLLSKVICVGSIKHYIISNYLTTNTHIALNCSLQLLTRSNSIGVISFQLTTNIIYLLSTGRIQNKEKFASEFLTFSHASTHYRI